MWRRKLRDYYNLVAETYPNHLAPTFEKLATGLSDLAAVVPGDKVIDLGAGTGAASKLAESSNRPVICVDLSREMLRGLPSGRTYIPIQVDMHSLGFRSSIFNVALASFSINATDPTQAMNEAYRILSPGGRLIMQEWGPEDHLSQLIFETLAEYAVDNPSADLAHLRELVSRPIPWDNLDSMDDISSILRGCGFEIASISTITTDIVFRKWTEFVKFKLAWPSRRRELAEMPAELRTLFYSDLEEQLSQSTNGDYSLTWRPQVIRVRAVKSN